MMSDETKKQVILMSVGIVLHNLVLFFNLPDLVPERSGLLRYPYVDGGG